MSESLSRFAAKVKGGPDRIHDVLAANGVTIKMNLLTGREMVSMEAGEELEVLNNHHRGVLVSFLRGIDTKFGSAVDITRNLGIVALRNSFHPVRDYLDSLQWDYKSRIDRWLVDYMQAEDSEFVRAVGRLFLIAACRRVRNFGCKFDECLVLIGKEGIGKSTAIKALVPNHSLFCDSLPLGQDPKQTVEKTEGVWICESAELVGNSPAKINEIKAFLSRQEDGPFRAAYGVESTVRKRQFVPIATNNDPLFLSSMHGNRRFWPVRVWYCDFERIAADRDQLWAEANVMEKAGESLQLDKELWDEAAKKQEEHLNHDPWEETLCDLPSKVRLDEIWAKLNVPVERRKPSDSGRIAAIMQKLGRRRVRSIVNGKKYTFYQKLTPLDEESFDPTPRSAKEQELDDMHSELRADEIAAETEPEEPDVPEGAEWVSAFAQNRPEESE